MGRYVRRRSQETISRRDIERVLPTLEGELTDYVFDGFDFGGYPSRMPYEVEYEDPESNAWVDQLAYLFGLLPPGKTIEDGRIVDSDRSEFALVYTTRLHKPDRASSVRLRVCDFEDPLPVSWIISCSMKVHPGYGQED